MSKNFITKEGLKELKKELDYLIKVKRPEILKQLQEAREQGDLSENADYDAAKNAQAQIEGRIKELQDQIDNSTIIEKGAKKSGSENDIVKLSSIVTIYDVSDKKEYTYQILGSTESDPANNKISNECQLAKSILGKKVGDEIIVKGVENPYKVIIKKIS